MLTLKSKAASKAPIRRSLPPTERLHFSSIPPFSLPVHDYGIAVMVCGWLASENRSPLKPLVPSCYQL